MLNITFARQHENQKQCKDVTHGEVTQNSCACTNAKANDVADLEVHEHRLNLHGNSRKAKCLICRERCSTNLVTRGIEVNHREALKHALGVIHVHEGLEAVSVCNESQSREPQAAEGRDPRFKPTS